jgi:hypothetical protein
MRELKLDKLAHPSSSIDTTDNARTIGDTAALERARGTS